MRKLLFILLLLTLKADLYAQEEIRCVIPSGPVVVGESFQVQYIINAKSGNISFKAPVFYSFRFVTGPYEYPGSVNNIQTNNYVYTLEATKAGRFTIPPASAIVNGKSIKSAEMHIEVITQKDAEKKLNAGLLNSEYSLRPGENPYDKIRQNLFLKVMVDRRNCYAGEPILATFKLYSRLQSRSDIVKNPGFYGFTVHDMVNLGDKQMDTEEINGKLFDVHTIRKVQLFPLSPGVYTIDPMEVVNRVEFSRSSVNKKTEQEISEGVLGMDNDETVKENTVVYETKLSTSALEIKVAPLPVNSQPAEYNGAVGSFTIRALLNKNELLKNEEGMLEIIIIGQGNFTQLTAPEIKWPGGVEGFDPVVKDSFDRSQVPLKGERRFRYSFSAAHPGQYQIPALSFHFFNKTSGYKTIESLPLSFVVSNKEKVNTISEKKKTSITATNASASRIAAIIVISIIAIILIYWISYKKKQEEKAIEPAKIPTAIELLQPAIEAVGTEDRSFFSILHNSIWEFFHLYFPLAGSDSNKEALLARLRNVQADDVQIREVDALLNLVQAGMFTSAKMGVDQQTILENTKRILLEIEKKLQAPGNA